MPQPKRELEKDLASLVFHFSLYVFPAIFVQVLILHMEINQNSERNLSSNQPLS